jgi:hypothetical protein
MACGFHIRSQQVALIPMDTFLPQSFSLCCRRINCNLIYCQELLQYNAGEIRITHALTLGIKAVKCSVAIAY